MIAHAAPSPRRAGSRLAAIALFTLVYMAAALWLVSPSTDGTLTPWAARIIGHPHGDSGEYLNLMWWFRQALATGQSPFFHAGIVFPYGAGASLLWSLPLQSFPAWALGGFMPAALAFNLTIVGFLVLNGGAMAWLAALVTRSQPAALVAGLVYLSYPAFQGQVGAAHIGLIAAFGAPLMAGCALVAGRAHTAKARWRWRAAGALAFAVSGWGGFVLFLYLTAPALAWLGLRAWADARRAAALRDLAAITAGGLALAAVFLVPFALDRGGVPLADVGGVVAYSAPVLSIVSPSFAHPLYRALPWPHTVLGRDPFELTGYVGLLTAALAAAALGARRPGARALLAVVVLCWLASLGPLLKWDDAPVLSAFDGFATPITLPYAWLADLPGFSLTRTPARFHFGMGFAAALLAGWGAAALFGWMGRRTPRPARWAAAGALCALVAFDTRVFWPMPSIDAALPAAVAGVGALTPPEAPAVFNIPWSHPLTENRAMYAQTAHGRPMLGGHIARRTPLDPTLADVLETTLNPALLHAAGVGAVIVHRANGGPEMDARARAALGEPRYEDAEWGVYAVPAERPPLPDLAYTPALAVPLDDARAVSLFLREAGQVVVEAELTGAMTVTLADAGIATVLEGSETRPARFTFAMSAGYHRLVFTPAAPCPRLDGPTALACLPFAVDDVRISLEAPAP